jgi:hypothetical protein
MAYLYCSKCDHECDEPTDEEVLTHTYACANCGNTKLPASKCLEDVVLSLMERIGTLEAEVKQLRETKENKNGWKLKKTWRLTQEKEAS